MLQPFIKGGFLLSILMFGFILGILYNDYGFDTNTQRFNITTETNTEIESQPKYNYIEKKQDSNIIDMEDGEGLVVYQEDDEEIHEELQEQLPANLEKTNEQANTSLNIFFSEIGLRTAGALEQVFQKLLSSVDWS